MLSNCRHAGNRHENVSVIACLTACLSVCLFALSRVAWLRSADVCVCVCVCLQSWRVISSKVCWWWWWWWWQSVVGDQHGAQIQLPVVSDDGCVWRGGRCGLGKSAVASAETAGSLPGWLITLLNWTVCVGVCHSLLTAATAAAVFTDTDNWKW